MSFIVDYPSMDALRDSIINNNTGWKESLTKLNEAIEELINSSNIQGEGANSAKSYFNTIHTLIMSHTAEAISAYQAKYVTYLSDYHSKIDTSTRAVIKQSELKRIKSDNTTYQKNAVNIDGAIQNALSSISDIFQVSRPDLQYVDNAHTAISTFINDVISDVNSLESAHSASDFTELSQSLKTIKALIDDCQAQPRSFITGFSQTSLLSLGSFGAFIEAYNALHTDTQNNQQKYAEAYEIEEDHIKTLSDELEAERLEREEKAKWIKIGIAAVGVIASVAVVVATGGAAAPLVMGAVGAATGVLTTGANKVVDRWAETGENGFSVMGEGEFWLDVGVAGATGFISGWLGGNVKNALGGVGWIDKGLNSTNLFARAGTAGVVGGLKDLSTGVVTNTIEELGEFAKTGKFDASKVALDTLGDAAGGFLGGAVGESIDVLSEKTHIDADILNNNNRAYRTAGGALYGSGKEVVSGMAERFADESIDNQDILTGIEKAIDGEEIVKDAMSGAGSGGADSYVDKPVGHELKGDDLKSSRVRNAMPENAPNYKEWREGGGKIYRDSRGNITYESKDLNENKSHSLMKDKRRFVYGAGDSSYNRQRNMDLNQVRRNSQKINDFATKHIPSFN